MMITLLLLMFFFCFTVIKQLNNYYSVVYSLTLFSIMMILLLSSFYINITALNIYFFQVEKFVFMLFNKLSRNNFSIFNIRTALYFAICVYLFAMYMAAVQNQILKKRLPLTIAVICGLMLMLFLNSNTFLENLYLKYHLSDNINYRKIYPYIYELIYGTNVIIFLGLSLLPHIQVLRKYSEIRMIYKKKQVLLFSLMLLILQVFIAYLICFSPIRSYFINRSIYSLFEYPVIIQSDAYYISFFIMITIILFLSVTAIFRLKIFEEIRFFKARKLNQNSRYVFNDIRPVFHSIKNSLILINSYNTQMEQNIDNRYELQNILKHSQETVEELFSNISTFLNSYKKQALRFTDIEFNSFVSNIVNSLVVPEDIKIVKNISEEEIIIFGDKYALHDAVYNIIQNSVEAIVPNEGTVTISVWTEDEYACLSVRDNGCGIPHRNLKKIFNPLFSTKQSHSNWGLGLAHTQKNIKAHLGLIEVQSKIGVGTEFQISIPKEGGTN